MTSAHSCALPQQVGRRRPVLRMGGEFLQGSQEVRVNGSGGTACGTSGAGRGGVVAVGTLTSPGESWGETARNGRRGGVVRIGGLLAGLLGTVLRRLS